MEFGSAILGDIWGLETTPDAAVFEAKQTALKTKFARVEEALGPGPFFAGERICLAGCPAQRAGRGPFELSRIAERLPGPAWRLYATWPI
jgi:glutathione S-transferase